MKKLKAEKEKLLNDPAFRDNPWGAFEQELDQWQKAEMRAEFWWRDDDAIKDGPQLQKLLKLSQQTPMTLAIIPTLLEDSLPPLLIKNPKISVAQHGYAHQNHAPADQKKAEFQDHRAPEQISHELYEGAKTLQAAFGPEFIPLFVPPWNRIGIEAETALKEIGIEFLSTFTPRPLGSHPYQINTHIDPVNWRQNSSFLGEAESLAQAILHLRAKREIWPDIDMVEPTGFLTHHAIHDPESWAFIERFDKVIHQHVGAHWLDISDYVNSFSV